MTDHERKDVEQILYALKRVEWGGSEQKCPVCGRAKAYGQHPCSCPVRLGLRSGTRLLGNEPVAPSQDELTVLVTALRKDGEGQRDALSYSGGGPDTVLLVEQAADVIEQWLSPSCRAALQAARSGTRRAV